MATTGVHLRESFCLAQVQLAEHAAAEFLHNDQFVARKLLQVHLVVHEQRVKVAVRVEMVVVEWRGRCDAAVASVQRCGGVGAVAVRVAVIAARFHAVQVVVVECHAADLLVRADLRGRVVLLLRERRRRDFRRLREDVVEWRCEANADIATWHFWQ
jgi:hypothetical protein